MHQMHHRIRFGHGMDGTYVGGCDSPDGDGSVSERCLSLVAAAAAVAVAAVVVVVVAVMVVVVVIDDCYNCLVMGLVVLLVVVILVGVVAVVDDGIGEIEVVFADLDIDYNS